MASTIQLLRCRNCKNKKGVLDRIQNKKLGRFSGQCAATNFKGNLCASSATSLVVFFLITKAYRVCGISAPPPPPQHTYISFNRFHLKKENCANEHGCFSGRKKNYFSFIKDKKKTSLFGVVITSQAYCRELFFFKCTDTLNFKSWSLPISI